MKHKEFLFEYSMNQILLLIHMRVQRQEEESSGEKKGSNVPRSPTHPDAKPGSLSDAFVLKKLLG